MEILVYATLRDIVGGRSVDLAGVTEIRVGEMVERLFVEYPAMKQELLNGKGEMHSAFHILINGRDARYLDGEETLITEKDEIRIFPPVGGGV